MEFIGTHRLSILVLPCALLGLGSQNALARVLPSWRRL